jgi:hypothetical protein
MGPLYRSFRRDAVFPSTVDIVASMTFRLLAAVALALALGASPAAAATLTPLKPCYVSNGPATDQLEDVTVHGDGFVRSSTVEVLVDGVPVASAPTDVNGEFQVLIDPPYQISGERPFTVMVQDGVNVLAAPSRVTNLNVMMRPKRSAPERRVRFRGRGFTQAAPVFAHYLYGGKEQKTVRLARRSTAPCGTFDVKRRQIPIEDARTGRWVMQVDQKRAYSPQPDPVWVRLPITVAEVFLEP